jgi:hypothetical protein
MLDTFRLMNEMIKRVTLKARAWGVAHFQGANQRILYFRLQLCKLRGGI